MMRVIPLPELVSANTRIEVLLDEGLFTLTLSWSPSGGWYLDVDGLCSGVGLRLHYPLWLGRPGMPKLMLVTASADTSEPGRYDLGQRCQLALITSAEDPNPSPTPSTSVLGV